MCVGKKDLHARWFIMHVKCAYLKAGFALITRVLYGSATFSKIIDKRLPERVHESFQNEYTCT